MLLFPQIFVLLILPNTGFTEELIEDLKSVDKSNWIDPNDMINFDPVSKKYRKPISLSDDTANSENEKLKSLEQDLLNCQQNINVLTNIVNDRNSVQPDFTILKHIVRNVLRKLNLKESVSESAMFDVVLSLSKTDIVTLYKFLNEDDPGMNMAHDCRQIIDNMIHRVKKHRDPLSDQTLTEHLFSYLPMVLQIANFFVLIPACGLVMYHVTRVNKWMLFTTLLFFSFLVSVLWTWLHLYKEKQVELQVRMMKVPGECRDGQSAPEYSWYKYLSKVFFISTTDQCVQYQKDLLIDPIWEVPPTIAIAKTITKFFVEPLEHIGEHLSKFFNSLFGNLHWSLWLPASIFLYLFFIIMAIFMFGYSIRLPFGLLRLEKGPVMTQQCCGQVAAQQCSHALTEPVPKKVSTAPALHAIETKSTKMKRSSSTGRL